jgi:importin subunit alpha-1
MLFAKAIKDENATQLSELAQNIRKIVSVDDFPPIQELIESGALPYIISILDKKYLQYSSLLTEICWIIANVSSSNTEHVAKLIELRVIPKSIDLLQHGSQDMNDNIVWILANIAGDSFDHRNILLENNIVQELEKIVSGKSLHFSFINNLSWLISNLCRGKPYPSFKKVTN